MHGHEAAAHLDILQGAARERCSREWTPVVAEADSAGRAEFGHLGELLAGEPAGDGREEPYGYRGLGAGFLGEAAEDAGRVDDRIGVGHGEDRHVAARRRGPRAGRDVLFVLAPRRAQMGVQVDEAGQHEHVAGIDDPGGLAGLELLAEPGDLALGHEHVLDGVDAGLGVDDAAALDEEVGRRPALAPRALHQSTSPLGRAVAVADDGAVEDRHAHGETAEDLVGDEVLVVVGDVRGDLHAAVDGAGVHDPLPRPQTGPRDAVELAVLAQRREEVGSRLDALLLNAQQIDDVGVLEVRQVVLHLDAHLFDAPRHERRRTHERDVHAEHLEAHDVAARDAAVQDVADDEDAQALEIATEVLAHAEQVEQTLRGVLMLAVAGVDDAGLGVGRERLAGAGGGVTHDDDVG